MRDLLLALASSIVGGLVVLIVERIVAGRNERKRQANLRRVRVVNADRIITNDIFQSLGPSNSVGLMKEMLGVENKYKSEDFPVFSEEMVATNSYLYMFKNAMLKITSRDNKTIDTLTVMSSDGSLSVEGLLFPCNSNELRLGKVVVCPELLDGSKCEFIQTRIDASFAIYFSTAAPAYLSYTYFGFADEAFEFHKTKDPNLFLGGTIDGVCISQMGENGYYIYYRELVMTGTISLSD